MILNVFQGIALNANSSFNVKILHIE